MRLLIVTQTLDARDPILGFFVQWVREFASAYDSVTVLALNVGTYTLPESVRVECLGKSEGRGRLVWLARLVSLSLQSRTTYDHVFVHMTPIHVVLAGLLWRILGKRVGLWYTHSRVDLKLRIATVLAHHIFTASDESFRIKTRKKEVTGHGIDVRLFPLKTKIDVHAPRLIVTGRISPIKHIEHALEALAQLLGAARATLTIVGGPRSSEDRVYEESCKALAHTLRISESVSWHGPVPPTAIPKLLESHDIFVHTSRTESADKTLLEAMLTGLLVVTSNRAFERMLPDMCFSEPHGASYAEKITVLLQLPEEMQERMRRDLRSIVEKEHNLPSLIRRIAGIYSSDFASRGGVR